MADTTNQDGAAPAFSQGQTTSVGQNTQTVIEADVVEGPPQEEGASIFSNPILWIAAALWLYIIFGTKKKRAMREQEKKERARRETMQKGDQIVTIGRLHGTVVAFTDTTVTIKPDQKSDHTMTFDRQGIFRVLPRPGEEPDADPMAGK